MGWTRKRKVRAVLVGVGVGVVLLLGRVEWGNRWQRIHLGRATTFVTGPLRADGTVDYIAAMNARYGAGVTAENNAAVPLMELLVDGAAAEREKLWRFGEALGAPSLGATRPAAPYFEQFDPVKEKRAGREVDDVALESELIAWEAELNVLRNEAWRAEAHPVVAVWLAGNAGVMERLSEAATRERFFLPLVAADARTMLIAARIAPVGYVRSAADAFVLRATLRLGLDDLTGARSDIRTAMRLGYLLGQPGTTIERLVALDIIEKASGAYGALLRRRKLSLEEGQSVFEEMRGWREVPSVAETVDWYDRCCGLDIATLWARFGPKEGTPPAAAGPFSFGLWPVHFDSAMQESNELMDRIVAAAAVRPFKAREEALVAAQGSRDVQLPALSYSLQNALRMVAQLPAAANMRERFRREGLAQERLDLVRGAAGVSVYFAEHPERLDSGEIGKRVAALGKNPFTGEPLAWEYVAGELMIWCEGPEPISGAGRRKDLVVRVRLR